MSATARHYSYDQNTSIEAALNGRLILWHYTEGRRTLAGNSDMSSNGNQFDPMASWARLSERVENQGKDIVDLRSNMNTGFQTINSSIGTLSNELRSSSKTQWPVIWAAAGVCFTVLVTIGTFFYSTLSKSQDRIDISVAKVSENSLSVAAFQDFRSTYENNRVVSRNDYIDKFGQLNVRLDTVTKDQVPRAELERVWQSDDMQKAQLQSQINELKANQSATYGARDVLLDLKATQQRLERELAEVKARGGQ
jgi:hypothetical protein